jgi:predicted PurR-regulated permease PerM
MKKKIMVIVLTTVFVFSMQMLIANAIGINIIDLLKQKTDSLTTQTVLNSSDSLEQAKKETLEETSTYVDNYLNDIKQSLDQYANSETEAAKLKLKQKAQEVKDTLEASKTQAIESSKTQIKIKIDEDLNNKLSELDDELSIKIQEKFK